MKKVVHRADSRGQADHGWLKANHSFSFASYQDPERMGFGLLRVINDDSIAPIKGFDTHPHKDMEIVTVPLRGSLRHKDSVGNTAVIQHGEVQLMSAGTGVFHSEFNASDSEELNLLQIWVLPEKLGIDPRYDQKQFESEGRKNKFQTIVSPMDKSEDGVKINQQSYFSLFDLDQGKSLEYKVKQKGNGIYLFVIDGQLNVAEESLSRRDAIGVEDIESLEIEATQVTQALIIEVPMS